MKMYVGGLQYSTTDQELNELFSQFGQVESIDLIKDHISGQSKGFGFIEMPNAAADTAIKALNGSSFQGRNIKVNQAQNKPKSNNRSRRGGGRY